VIHSRKLQPYPQTLDYAGEACQGQTLELIAKIQKLAVKGLIVQAPVGRNGENSNSQFLWKISKYVQLIFFTWSLIFKLEVYFFNKQ